MKVINEKEWDRRLFEDSEDAILRVVEGNKLIAANLSASQLFGYSREEMIGMDVRSIYANNEDHAKLQNKIEKKGSVSNYEAKLRKKDGKEVYCLLNMTATAENGEIIGYQGSVRNITKQKKAVELYKTLANSSQVGVYVVLNGVFEFVNPHIMKYSGYRKRELIGRDPVSLIHPEDRDMVRKNSIRMLNGHRHIPYEYRSITKDNRIIWILETVISIDYFGERAFLGNSIDITEDKEARSKLKEAKDFESSILSTIPHAVFGIENRRIIFASDSVENVFGWKPEELIGKSTKILYRSIEDWEDIGRRFYPVLESENTYSEEFPCRRKDGTDMICRISTSRIGQILKDKSIVSIYEDITERKHAEDALRRSEEKYSAVVEQAIDGIIIIENNVISFANHAMAEISGYKREETIGSSTIKFFVPEYSDFIQQRNEWIQAGENVRSAYETKIKCKDGAIKDVEISFGAIPYIGRLADMGFVRDITERKKAEEAIRQLAYHDALTGLANRVLFNEQFDLARAYAERNKRKLAIMLLDLDHFKEINDTLGHNVGDQLLQMVGKRLNSIVRKEDIVARMGGDEFMLMLQEVNCLKDLENTAQKIVDSFRTPFIFDSHTINITTSVGIAIYPKDGEDIDILLKNSDIAMYRSKKEGRNRYQLYS